MRAGLQGIVLGSLLGVGIPLIIKTSEVYSNLKLKELVSVSRPCARPSLKCTRNSNRDEEEELALLVPAASQGVR